MAHLKKNVHSHHNTNNTNLLNIKGLLDDIKTNTNSVNLNTDTLETKLTDGTQKSQVLGNTAADGSGDSKHLLTDSSGNVQIRWTNTPNVKLEDLSSSINADNANHSRSIAVGMRGRTDIADSATGEFLLCNSSGRLQVDVVTGAGGDASSANQLTTHSKLDTIETSLNSIETINTDAEAHLGNIQANTNTNLSKVSSIDGKMTQGYDATISSGGDGLQQIIAYGRDSSGNLDALNVDNNGHLKIAVDTVENKGSQANVQNGTLNFGSSSSSVDVSDFNHATFLYEDTNTSTFDNPKVEVSINNTDFYELSTQPLINTGSSKRTGTQEYKLHGVRYLRISNNSTADNFTNAKATIVGTPN